jgi:hypothetical protein
MALMGLSSSHTMLAVMLVCVLSLSFLGVGLMAQPETFYPAQTGTMGNQWTLFSSNSGSFLVAASQIFPSIVYTSSDFGRSWTAAADYPEQTYYMSLAGSSTGDLLVTITYPSTITEDIYDLFYSVNFGQNWTKIEAMSGVTWPWTDVDCSATGQYCIVASNGHGMFISSDSAKTWSQVPSSALNLSSTYWVTVAMSGTGQYIAATNFDAFHSDSPHVYISRDFGATWSPQPNLTAPCYDFATIDTTGMYVTVNDCSTTKIFSSSDLGETWTTLPSGSVTQLASSDSGEVILAATDNQLWLSNTYGGGFVKVGPNPDSQYSFTSVAASASGEHMVAGASQVAWIQFSDDYGITWSSADISDHDWTQYSVNGLAMSSAGDIVYAAAQGGGIFKSTNFGETWTLAFSNDTNYWGSIACNSAGTIVVAGTIKPTISSNEPGQIWVSSDSGATWDLTNARTIGTSWVTIASDSSGTHFAAASAYTTGIWLSSDGGLSWSVSEGSPDDIGWSQVTSDSTGQYLFLAGDGNIFNSSDFGQTWSSMLPTNTSRLVYSVTTNSSGNMVIAGVLDTLYLYTAESGWSSSLSGNVKAVVAAVDNPQNMVAVTTTGLWTSTSYGALWSAASYNTSEALDTYWWTAVSDAAGVNLVANYYLYQKLPIWSTNVNASIPLPTPVPTDAPSSAPQHNDNNGASTAVIAGAVVGCVGGAAVLGAAGYYFFVKEPAAASASLSEPLTYANKL